MADADRYDDLLWDTLRGNGWRDDDAALVDAFEAEFPDVDELPGFVAEADERLRHAALVAATLVTDAGVARGPMWDGLGVALVYQWARWLGRGRAFDVAMLIGPPEDDPLGEAPR